MDGCEDLYLLLMLQKYGDGEKTSWKRFVVEIPLFTGVFFTSQVVVWDLLNHQQKLWNYSEMIGFSYVMLLMLIPRFGKLTLMIWHHQLELHIQTQIHLKSSIETSVCKFAKSCLNTLVKLSAGLGSSKGPLFSTSLSFTSALVGFHDVLASWVCPHPKDAPGSR